MSSDGAAAKDAREKKAKGDKTDKTESAATQQGCTAAIRQRTLKARFFGALFSVFGSAQRLVGWRANPSFGIAYYWAGRI